AMCAESLVVILNTRLSIKSFIERGQHQHRCVSYDLMDSRVFNMTTRDSAHIAETTELHSNSDDLTKRESVRQYLDGSPNILVIVIISEYKDVSLLFPPDNVTIQIIIRG